MVEFKMEFHIFLDLRHFYVLRSLKGRIIYCYLRNFEEILYISGWENCDFSIYYVVGIFYLTFFYFVKTFKVLLLINSSFNFFKKLLGRGRKFEFECLSDGKKSHGVFECMLNACWMLCWMLNVVLNMVRTSHWLTH